MINLGTVAVSETTYGPHGHSPGLGDAALPYPAPRGGAADFLASMTAWHRGNAASLVAEGRAALARGEAASARGFVAAALQHARALQLYSAVHPGAGAAYFEAVRDLQALAAALRGR